MSIYTIEWAPPSEPVRGMEAQPHNVDDDGYVAVEGLDRNSVEHIRALEQRAAAKTASDYAHVVWAYGILWALFAGYGVLLWRRTVWLSRSLAQLRGGAETRPGAGR